MATNAQQTIRELRQEIKALSSQLEKSKKNLGNGSLSHLHITRDDIRELAENAGESAREFFLTKREQSRELAENAAHKYEESVSAHPWKATAFAALGGAVLSALFFGRR